MKVVEAGETAGIATWIFLSFWLPPKEGNARSITTASMPFSTDIGRNIKISLTEQFSLPLLHGGLFELWAHHNGRRKLLKPFKGPAGVDNHARAKAFFILRNGRVQRSTPGAADNLHRLRRVDPRTHSPEDIVDIRDVDVIINHQYISSQVGHGMTLASD